MQNHWLKSFLIPFAVVLSAYLLAHAWKRTHRQGETITVTGLAAKDFTSDLIVWSGSFSRKSQDLKEAYNSLSKDRAVILTYLQEKGISAKEIVFSSVSINRDYNSVYNSDGTHKDVFTGYTLTQKVEISSRSVEKVEKVAREVTEIINKDIEFYSFSPDYYYTKLDELKIQMLAAAAQNARQRAGSIAKNAGCRLGSLRNADMGIFQITARNSAEDFSWGGTFNTSSKEKTARITIKTSYFVN